MASDKRNGRDDRSNRGSSDPRRRRAGLPWLESLEDRRLLAGGATPWHATTGDIYDTQNGPMANLGTTLIDIYRDYATYVNSGSTAKYVPPAAKSVLFQGTNVGVDVRGTGNFAAFQQSLTAIGMKITATSTVGNTVEGYIPIANLYRLAISPQINGATPIYRPIQNFIGIGNNESDQTLQANTARSAYGVDGTGQSIGVLSDSVNEYPRGVTPSGLAQSQATGDLGPVTVVQDDPDVDTNGAFIGTDEGRAMLEQIHDIAPGAALAFATGDTGQAGFATNINALAKLGDKTIVDDLTYIDETAFQDGIVTNAVNQVTATGVTYLSSASNNGDGGYLSNFRGITATVGSLGTGTYHNFDGTGATSIPTLGIRVASPSGLYLQFDQPLNGVTSDLQLELLDTAGNLVAQSTINPAATGEPFVTLTDTTGAPLAVPAGQYQVAVKVLSGANPGHLFVYTAGDGNIGFDHSHGSSGGTYYSATFGHNAAANTISVGAVPFWGAQPFQSATFQANNEPYSSFGPVISEFNADGTTHATTTLLKPDISAPDGNNTSFFIPGQLFDTSQDQIPAYVTYPGSVPRTFTTPLTPANDTQANLPIFTGTSSAAPNLAAVVALMKQATPSVTNSQILAALISTASPLDGASKGVWTPQGGFGLANATAAIGVVSALQVTSITPGSSSTLTSIPYAVTVNFSKAVNLATLSAASLQIVGANGSTVIVGNPIGLDNATFPTSVGFPILIVPAPGRIANGIYTETLLAGSIKGQDGTSIKSSFSTTFNLQDTVAPRVAGTSINGRIITVTFNSPVNPLTITPANLFLFRANGVNNPLFNSGDVIVSQLPGAVVSYNPTTLTATIDLTAVPQAQLPTDHYAIAALNAITDQIGNPLNGYFNGVFPSGVTPSTTTGSIFLQDLGVINVTPPIISALVLNPASDTGILGDSDTSSATPSFIGQVTALFPGNPGGLQVYVQFNGIAHPGLLAGGINLAPGANNRGIVGTFDALALTDSTGRFVVNYPVGITPLPEGQNIIRAVVVGAPDIAGLAGQSSAFTATFQVDRTLPYVGTINGTAPTSVAEMGTINNLSTLSISVVDPVNPTSLSSPFAVNAQTKVTALNPVTADNLANYGLYLVTGTNTYINESSFLKNANFVSTSNRVLTSDPFTGRIDLSFASGLPQGRYVFLVNPPGTLAGGVTDAAGNSLTNSSSSSSTGTAAPFILNFSLQPTPTYITGYAAYSADSAGNAFGVVTDTRASYEIPATGRAPGAPAPPTAFTIDFSNQLSASAATTLANLVQLVRSANSATATPDGDFGNFGTAAGLTNPTGFTRVNGINVQLVNSIPTATVGQYGYLNRLLITLPAGTTLPADYYRVYLPNTGTRAVNDIYGNQLDGEFLGYENAAGKYVDQLNDGSVRGSGAFDLPDLSGDGIQGGAFVTGFVVVPNGNVIYARPDAIYNPQLPGSYPDGTAAKPYPVLAAEATPTALNGGDLNSVVNSGINFNTVYDRSGLGTFQPSAFFAAQEKARVTQAPVVIIAEPALPTRNPLTGVVTTQPFVLQAPTPSQGQFDPVVNDGSAAVPAMTTLEFAQGSTLKMLNASLLVQNQGSALQILGGPNPGQLVNVTSYRDASIGGATNGDASQLPTSGDYGGIIFRNYNETNRTATYPGQLPITGFLSSDGRLKGPFTTTTDRNSQLDAVSGADPVMSYVNFLVEKYAGGNVPQTQGVGVDGITMINSRPSIVNTTIALAGVGAAQAGLSVDVDSLLKDDTASGPLLRNDTFSGDGINGIYIRGQIASGVAEPTNATNTANIGGTGNSVFAGQQYILDDPYPYVLTTPFNVGSRLQVETSGNQAISNDRLYISPGMIVKFNRGAGINVASAQAGVGSINVGDTTYIREFDANNEVNPSTPGFKANSAALAPVIFTSIYDDVATTTFTDPITGVTRTVVPALATTPGGAGVNQPTSSSVPTAARWGGLNINPNTIAVVNGAVFRYGGGQINDGPGTATEHVLEIGGATTTQNLTLIPSDTGAKIMVTNNSFTDNSDVPINLQPDSLAAGDPTRPLLTGDPFIHGNTFVRNTYNAVGVNGGSLGPLHDANVDVDSTWTGTDFTYLIRDTIIVGPPTDFGFLRPPVGGLTTTPTPNVTLTLQSTLPGTTLADGTVVAAPGLPLIIKTLNQGPAIPTETDGVTPAAASNESYAGGAGFIVGVDNGIDPPTPAESYLDNGAFSQLRILGIPGNQSTGQVRVPVTITSIHDNTVGTTVNGVAMNQVIPNDPRTPSAGDGGLIYFGGNSLTTYDLQDLRSGSVIDNADIRYMTRIEQQGGGILYTQDVNGDNSFSAQNDDPFEQKYGVPNPLLGGFAGELNNFIDQYNQPKKLAIEDSNLSTFADGGIVSHPGFASLAYPYNYPSTTPFIRSIQGEPTQLYLVNDTITNMTAGRGTGVEVISETGDDTPNNGVAPSPSLAIILNTTFYNDKTGINAVGQAADGNNVFSAASILAMDDIFANMGTAITGSGQVYGSESEYSLFYNNAVDVAAGTGIANNVPISGNPGFRNAAAGNFNLTSTSAAIDQGRSELGPSIFGDMLYPAATILTTNINALPIRNQIGDLNFAGGYNGGDGLLGLNTAIVTLPGEPILTRGFPDQWIPVTTGAAATGTTVTANQAAASSIGTAGNGFIFNTDPNTGLVNTRLTSSTYAYAPLLGERDVLGNLRSKDPNSPNIGSGAQFIFDVGAYEYIVQNPPLVESVSAVSTTGTSTNLYVPGSIAGTNQYPGSIRVGINERLNPATITPGSVQLIGSGGDGVFGNANDITYNLNNRLSFDNTTDSLIINTAGLFPTGAALNDEYEVVLKGTGSAVLRDNNGLALDGYTNNNTLPLPSGSDDFPGSDFSVMFTIDTSPPALISGSFGLAAGTFKTAAATAGAANVGPEITNNLTPTFVGKVTDIFPPANPLQGDTVFVDISTTGDPNNFNLLGVATGTTDANGNFAVTVNQALANSPYLVGPDGKQGTLDDTGYSIARVRVVDQAGNVSLLPSAPFSSFLGSGAALAFEEDHTPPQVTSLLPTSTGLTAPNASGQVIVTATFSKNIDPSTLNANSILVTRAGGSGTFTGTGIAVPIVAGSFNITYLGGGKGPIQVTFALQGPLPNDFYRITFKGTGANPIRDIAGNALDGLGTGVAGSGDFSNTPFTIFSPTNARLLYVDGTNAPLSTTATIGTREHPYTTISAAMTAAQTGDIVLVLPGTYREHVTMKGQVRLLSADSSSTDSGFLPGNPLSTIIYGGTSSSFNSVAGGTVILANNLANVAGVPTEISGFTILSPLLGDPVRGTLDTTSVGVYLANSNVTVDKNYIVNAGIGINVTTTGSNVTGPLIASNVIAGNYTGVLINDGGSTASYAMPTDVVNNTITDNTIGLFNLSSRPGVTQAFALNDIFYSNHDLSTSRAGTGILSVGANTLIVGFNDFYANGVSGAPSSNASGTFTNFNPAALTARPDVFGNILGDPLFVSPRDPRPNGDSPPTFFVYANYDLTSRSPAINAANNAFAPATDILYRSPVAIPGHGIYGTGPASIGAFYYLGTGSIIVTSGNGLGTGTTTTGTGTTPGGGTGTTTQPVGVTRNAIVAAAAISGNDSMVGGSLPLGTRQFDVVNTSLNPDGTTSLTPGVPTSISAPTSIVVNFSGNVDPATVQANDLVLSGTGLAAGNPAVATGLTWVDSHTVKFLLTGGFNSTGSVNLSIPAGAIKDKQGDSIAAYAESFQIGAATAAAAVLPAVATTVALPIQPVAVAGPIAVHYNAKSSKHHSAQSHAAATAKGHKKEDTGKAHPKAHAAAKAHAAKHGKATK